MQPEIIDRLELSRKELLDLGMRNPLLNHRKRAKQVEIVDELSTEIYRILVTEARTMSFDALPDSALSSAHNSHAQGSEDGKSELDDFLDQPEEEAENGQLAKRYVDNKLQTNLSSKKLQTRLLSIHNGARTHLEEKGVNALFVALGFLHWYEAAASQEARRAPLILIPVELQRSSAKQRFKVNYTGDDITDNLSLLEKLRNEFNIELPCLEEIEEIDVSSYFESVSNAVKGDERWKVKADEMTLGFFSFGKFLMYKDLDLSQWEKDNRGKGFSILDALLGEGFRDDIKDIGDDTQIDEVVSPTDLYHVMDADSTQVLAIMDVKAGKNFVLQGPPGTGKSQTITNVIAECIGRGRKVLFVSEKMAALEVVKRRLDNVGLGDAVIELHSHKTKKKQAIQEIGRTLNLGRPIIKNPDSDIKTLTILRDQLNEYCRAVNSSIGNTKTNFVKALGHSLRNQLNDIDEDLYDFTLMTEWTEEDYRTARMKVEIVSRFLADTGCPKKNPFSISKLKEFLPSQRPRLEKALNDSKEITEALLIRSIDLAQAMRLKEPEIRSDAEIICRAARRAMEAPHLEGVALTSGEWQIRRDDLDSLINAGQNLSQAHTKYDEWVIDDAWNYDLVKIRQEYVNKGTKWWRLFSGSFRAAKAELQGLSRKKLPPKTVEVIEMVDTILDSQKHQKSYDELSGLGESIFGAQWKKDQSDWEVLKKLAEWVVELYRDVGSGVVPEGIVNFLSGSPKVDELKEKVQEVEDYLNRHEELVGIVEELLQLNLNSKLKSHWGISLKKQSKYFEYWLSQIDRLQHLVRFNQISDELRDDNLGFIADKAKEWNYQAGSFLTFFDYCWYSGLVEKAYTDFPSIQKFDRSQQNYRIDEFSRLDRLVFQHNQATLASIHWSSLPNINGSGELNIINREINKKRRHMPIRKLMSEAGRAIQAIKPIFMMSPMSIATYIPPGSVQFDLVVFDEASQVKPVDAFGAIMRADQSVVVGDNKQLPPTSFFDSLVESEDEDDFDHVGDIESILSLFLGKGAPEQMLRWHYRSRHDSLIAVSNNEFYQNRLMVFPSPGVNPTARGLKFNHLPDTAYDRGKTRSNPKEAEAVAKAVLKHAKNYPDLSLGVAAFSTAQRDAIELQLELLRRSDDTCETFFNDNPQEPFFVKNLENVQGDERDVIYISIGYGKTVDGYMAMSFGPLNRDGGERRLNVLISRARLAMDVFSNFTADDIDLTRTKARGAIALKNFLAYAQTGEIQQPYSTGLEPDSPFEEAVIDALVQHGIDVEPQVGTAGFFIDIGIKDPEKPGRYIIGIECDGAMYHSSRSARDRDRLRQEVLEGLGWQLHRIWSTDWYRNPNLELERAIAAIERAKEQYKSHKVNSSQKPNAKDNSNAIKRESVTQQDNDINSHVNPYIRKDLVIYLGYKELHQLTAPELFEYVSEVVEVESPVHFKELTRRIVEGAGLTRSGSRINMSVKNAIIFGERNNKLCQKGEFIWHPEMSEPSVRNRSKLPTSSRKLEFVSPEEIRLAILQEVKRGFSMPIKDVATSAARVLGFQRVTAQSKKQIEAELAVLLNQEALTSRNDAVSIPS